MTIIKDLAVVKSTYTNKQGEEKKVWLNVGKIHTSAEGKEYLTLDPMINYGALPRRDGDDRLFVSMFDPNPKEQRSTAQQDTTPKQQDEEDSIPF